MNDFSALILAYFVINYKFKGISLIIFYVFIKHFNNTMVYWDIRLLYYSNYSNTKFVSAVAAMQ